MTVQPTRDQLSKRAGHILFTQGPEQPAATARETCVLLDEIAAAEQRIRDLTQEVRDERGAALDQMEQVKVRDARIAEEKRLRMKATAAATEAEARIKRLENRAASETARANEWRDKHRIMAEKRNAAHSAWASENEARREAETRIKAVEDVLDAEEARPRPIGGGYDKRAMVRIADIRRALDGDA